MNNAGFQLVDMRLSGPNLTDAYIEFKPGLNVVTGPSDTGKSYILECIDFALGKSDVPKAIQEAEGYETLELRIRVNSTKEILSLTRSLAKAGVIHLIKADGSASELGPRHEKDSQDNISCFLLDLIGFTGKRLKKNARNETQNLSFRNIGNLILIDEVRVTTKESPFYSGITTSRTVEKSLLNFLLTGNDDDGLIASEDPKISKAKAQGRLEVVLGLIEKYAGSVPDRFQSETTESLTVQSSKLASAITMSNDEIANHKSALESKESDQFNLRVKIIERENRLRTIEDLNIRFDLLGEQYAADLSRLEAVSEASQYFQEMREERCPVCGSNAEHHSFEHVQIRSDPKQIAEACKAEEKKTKQLFDELQIAKNEIHLERQEHAEQIQQLHNQYKTIGKEIDELTKPHLIGLVTKFTELKDLQALLMSTIEKKQQLSELNGMVVKLEAKNSTPKSDNDDSSQGISHYYHNLSQVVLGELKEWNFPEVSTISFNSNTNVFDFEFNGLARNSHGKGVRAILLTSIMVGLFKYCKSNSIPHPGFIVVDSPLVVYRKPDPDETGFNQDVKGSMYKSLSENFKDDQIIIIENVDPPQDIDAHIVHFTKNQTNRYGFIPAKAITEN